MEQEKEGNWGIFQDDKIGNPCQPKVKWNEDKGTWIIVHSAFDGRQALEEANEILKQNK